MIYSVASNDAINYNPKTTIEDIIRNVHTVLRVCKTEQPLMRDFAMDSDLIDKNIDVIESRIVSILLNLLKKYEPRAMLKNVKIEMLENNDFNILLQIEVIA